MAFARPGVLRKSLCLLLSLLQDEEVGHTCLHVRLTAQISERAGIARGTLIKVEKGEEGVAMGAYFRVLIALGLGQDILLLAKDDELGRKLQDAKLVVKERASKK